MFSIARCASDTNNWMYRTPFLLVSSVNVCTIIEKDYWKIKKKRKIARYKYGNGGSDSFYLCNMPSMMERLVATYTCPAFISNSYRRRSHTHARTSIFIFLAQKFGEKKRRSRWEHLNGYKNTHKNTITYESYMCGGWCSFHAKIKYWLSSNRWHNVDDNVEELCWWKTLWPCV